MYGFVRWLSLALFGGLFLQQAACEQPATDPGAPFMAPPNGCEAMLDTRAGDPPIKADSPAEGEDADDCPAPDTGSDAGPPNDGDVPMDDAETPNPDMGPPPECPEIDGQDCPADNTDCTFERIDDVECGYTCGSVTLPNINSVLRAVELCHMDDGGPASCDNPEDPEQQEACADAPQP
jgi:hypothetical protein